MSEAERKAFRKKQRRLRKNFGVHPGIVPTKDELLLEGPVGTQFDFCRELTLDLFAFGVAVLKESTPHGTKIEEVRIENIRVEHRYGLGAFHTTQLELVENHEDGPRIKVRRIHRIVYGLLQFEATMYQGFWEYPQVLLVWTQLGIHPERLRMQSAIVAMVIHETAHLVAGCWSGETEEPHGPRFCRCLGWLIQYAKLEGLLMSEQTD